MAEKVSLDIDIAALKAELQALQAEMQKTGSIATASFSTLSAGVKDASRSIDGASGIADAVTGLRTEYAQLKRSAETLQRALKTATDPTLIQAYARSIATLKAGMAELETASKKAGVSLRDTNKEAGTGRQVFEGFFGQLTKASLITAAVAAVGKFVTEAVELAEGIGKAQRSFEAFTGSAEEADKIVNALIETGQKNFIPTDKILQAGKALLAFGEDADTLPDVLTRIADISAATGNDINDLATIYGKARQAGVLYASDINQLVDAGIPIIQEFAKQLGVSNDQVKKLASEGKIGFEELQLAFFNLTKEGAKFADQSQTSASTISGVWTKLTAAVQPAVEGLGRAFSDAVKEAGNAAVGVIEYLKKVGAVLGGAKFFKSSEADELAADRRAYEADLNERLRLENDAEKARKERSKKSAKELDQIEREREQARIAGMKDGLEKLLAQEDFRFKELKKQLKKYHLDTSDAEAQHQENLKNIRLDYILKQAEEEQKRIAELEKLRAAREQFETQAAKKEFAAKKEAFEGIRDVRESEIDVIEENFKNYVKVLEANGAKKEVIEKQQADFDAQIRAERLENEIQFYDNLLSITDAGDRATIEQIKNRIARLQAELQGVSIEPKGPKDGFSLQDFLGLDDQEMEGFKKAVATVKAGLSDLAAARVKAAQAAVDAADKEVDAAENKVEQAEDALDRELEIAELGFASDVTRARQRLESAEQEEAEANARRERAIQAQQKAQRQQILLDTALQASNIVTAATDVFKGFAKIPIVGVGLGIGAVALLIASFVAAKAKALQAVKAREGIQGQISDTGIVVGPSHEQGGVPLEVEGGEFVYQDGRRVSVVKRRATREHFGLLQAINDDDRPAMAAYLDRMTRGVRRDSSALPSASGGATSGGGAGVFGDKETHRLLEENNRLQKRIIELEEERPLVIDLGDRVEIRTKRGTQKIRK